jgi:hypothetical protein
VFSAFRIAHFRQGEAIVKAETTLEHLYSEASWKPANKSPKTITLTGTILDANHVGIIWDTVPGNQPAKNGNLVAMWQNAGIPYGQPPMQKQSITKNDPTGDQIFEFPIQRKPYVAAYGTSDTGTAWAGTVQFTPGQGLDGDPFVTTIDVAAAGADSLMATFSTPLGNVPSANGNWIGLWQGPMPTFDGTNMIKKVAITASTADGTQSMSGLTLLMNTTYSLVYAVGPKASDLAAWVTFTTQPF